MADVDTSDPELALENIARLLGEQSLLNDPSIFARIDAELADFESDLYLFNSSSRSRIIEEIKLLRDLMPGEQE